MLFFCIGIILGIVIGFILTAAIAASGNSARTEEAYHIGFEDGKTVASQEIGEC